MSLRILAEPLARPLVQRWWRMRRGMTLGVRGLVENERGEILLVRHTYVAGWHFPGGGVERGETLEQAIIKELAEEGGVVPSGPPELLGIYLNERVFKGDHVALFRVRGWTPCDMTAHHEIAETGWFAPDALPEGTVGGVRRRLAELKGSAKPDGHW